MHKGFLAVFVVATLPSMAWGQAVGSEFQANTYTTNDQRRPTVGVFSNGDFVVVWQSNAQPSPAPPTTGQDGDNGGIFAQRFDSTGDKLGAEFRVNTYTTGGQFRPSVAVDPFTDGFVVVWDGVGSDDPNGIFGQRFDSSGTPAGSEFRINTYTTDGGQYVPQVATDALGNFVVVWEGAQDGGSGTYGSYGIFARRFDSSGSALDTSDFQVNTYTTGYQGYPKVAMHALGEFVVVWSSNDYDYNPLFPLLHVPQDGSGAGVFGQNFDADGVKVGSEFQVNTYTTGYQYRPTVAVDEGSGGFVVAWSGYTSAGGYGVTGTRLYGCCVGYPSGDFPIETSGGSSPALAVDSAVPVPLNFVVVWQSNHDGDFSGVFGKRFAGTGYPVGGEFQVNAYVTGNQVSPAIGMNPDGGTVVAWTSGTARRQFTPPGPTQDGDRDGIFGQVCGGTTDTDPPTVEVRSPMGTATLYAGKNYAITWTAADNCGLTSFNVLVSTDGGNNFSSICSNLPGTARSCTWTAPLPLTTRGRVRVVAVDPSTNPGQDDSNADFSVVSGTPSVTVTAPDTKGISWQVGSTQQIKWKHNLGNGELVRIEVNRNYPSGGWGTITEAAPSGGGASGAFNWVVTPPFLVGSSARIRITALGHTTATDVGDANFAITSRVKVTQPNTALAWAIGTTQTIKWTHNYGSNLTFNIQLDRDSSTSANPLETIASNVLGTGSGGSFKWSVTGPVTNKARIRVVKTGDGRGNDISDVDFTITQ